MLANALSFLSVMLEMDWVSLWHYGCKDNTICIITYQLGNMNQDDNQDNYNA